MAASGIVPWQSFSSGLGDGTDMRDVIVVGARCAGASTAMLLARAGLDVLLVDRGTFPSEIRHGHFIHRHGPRRLATWGLLDRVLATNCPPVTCVTSDFDDFPLTGRDLIVAGIPVGLGPRRSRFDQVLVDAAVQAGVELREGFVVEDVTRDGDRITGVRGRQAHVSTTIIERGAVVVGADGRNSTVARRVAAPASRWAPTVSCWYFSYWSGVPTSGLEIYLRERRMIFAFPTNDGLFALFVAWPLAELARVRADIEGELMAVVDRVPQLAERVRAGRREERFYGAAQLPNFLRKPVGPGWALVGDAGCHKDPVLALGVCDALRDAELLAGALVAGLSGRCPLPAALADYGQRRDQESVSDYHENLRRAYLRPPPAEVYAVRAAIRDSQADTNHFFLADEGVVPRET